MKKLVFCLFFIPFTLLGSVTDSLEKKLISARDTGRLFLLSELAWEYRNLNRDKAFEYAQEELALSQNLNNNKAKAQAYNDLGILYYLKGNFIKALENYNASLKLRRNLDDKELVASSLSKMGIIHMETGKYPEALATQLEVLTVYEQLKNKRAAAYTFNNIAEIYDKMHQPEQVLIYGKKAFEILKQINDPYGMAQAYGIIGNYHNSKKEYVLAIENLEKAAVMFLEIGEVNSYISCQNNIALNYRKLGDDQKGLKAYKSALSLSEKNNDLAGMALYSANAGIVLVKLGEYAEAEKLLKKSLSLSLENGMRAQEKMCYKCLTTLYIKTADSKKAEAYFLKYDELRDSIYSHETSKQIADIQGKYDIEKREKENLLLTKSILIKDVKLKARQTQLITLSAAALVIILSFLLYYSRYKAKQKTIYNEQLAKHKELRSKAVIDAEEKERIRIAKDLHDGVGQMLSAVKLNISGIDLEKDIKDEARRKMLRNALNLVDDSVKEVRTVSHQMMPSALIKSGLAVAVKEFISKINNPNLRVDLQIIGLEKRLDLSTESVLYRALQEIVNNIIKHAEASEVSIQIICDESELTLIVEDNGKGFNTSEIIPDQGIGLKNINSRIAYLNGTVDFDSTPGKGTTVTIEIPLQKTTVLAT